MRVPGACCGYAVFSGTLRVFWPPDRPSDLLFLFGQDVSGDPRCGKPFATKFLVRGNSAGKPKPDGARGWDGGWWGGGDRKVGQTRLQETFLRDSDIAFESRSSDHKFQPGLSSVGRAGILSSLSCGRAGPRWLTRTRAAAGIEGQRWHLERTGVLARFLRKERQFILKKKVSGSRETKTTKGEKSGA